MCEELDWLCPDWAAQRGCGVFLHEGFQILIGHCSAQPARSVKQSLL